MSKVISLRLDPRYIAKARDGLIEQGLGEEIHTITGIIRHTFFIGLRHSTADPLSEPTEESMAIVAGLITKTKPAQTPEEILTQTSKSWDEEYPALAHIAPDDRPNALRIYKAITLGVDPRDNLTSSNPELSRLTADILWPTRFDNPDLLALIEEVHNRNYKGE